LGDCHRSSLLGLGAGDLEVGLGLVGLELGTDVLSYVNISDVDR
jgi:hypothetical protein